MDVAQEREAGVVEALVAALERQAGGSVAGAVVAAVGRSGEVVAEGAVVEAMVASYVAGAMTALACPTVVGQYPALFTKAMVAHQAVFRAVVRAHAGPGQGEAVVGVELGRACRLRRPALAAIIAAAIRPEIELWVARLGGAQ